MFKKQLQGLTTTNCTSIKLTYVLVIIPTRSFRNVPDQLSEKYMKYFHAAANRVGLDLSIDLLKPNLFNMFCYSNYAYLETWEMSFMRLIHTGYFLRLLPLNVEQSTKLVQPISYRNARLFHFLLIYFWLDLCYLVLESKNVSLTKVSETEFVSFYGHFFSRLTAGFFAVIVTLNKKSMVYLNNILILMKRATKGKHLN